MKNIKLLLFTMLGLMTMPAFSQNVLSEGSIKMEITEIDSDNEQMAAQLEMLRGTATEYFFNEEKSLVSADMMGGMITMKSLVNNADEHLTFLFDAMGQKMMVKSTKEDRKQFEEEQNEAMEGVEIVYDESSTKEVLGYKCIKATLSGEEVPLGFEMWVAPDIKASNKLIQGMQAFELKGFPLEYVLEMDEFSMTFAATEVLKTVDAEVFKLKTDGYKEMTFEEFQTQMGSMGGGMGF
ncbi:MAG: hypothetical protein HKN67_07105 [Saprospiraceae bacterium]|nr:hypothetical protein [Bacteroidia bacterium]MBT8228786.1 hypothetical protein [Bacteroidia bacterium]NNF21692.1 hypothetical protein [Saprospiraceae bacterium]NNK90008.1 hypothetical protein [Saprospiraceae bacterium]